MKKPRAEYFRDDPGNISVSNIRDGTFELVFEGRTETGGVKRATFKLETWWVRYIARELWKVHKHQRQVADEMGQALRGES